jgi:hypothetical protein
MAAAGVGALGGDEGGEGRENERDENGSGIQHLVKRSEFSAE